MSAVMVAGLFVFSGCEESVVENKEVVLQNGYELPELLTTGLEVKNDMIVFKDRNHFDQVADLLESEIGKYAEDYYAQYSDLNEEEKNLKAEEDNFNPYVVVEKFEEYYNFKTLRVKNENDKKEWLKAENPEVDDYPFYPLSERCMNIANLDGEYMIGSTIYRTENDGLVYEIRNADFDVLSSIRNGSYDIWQKSENSNVVLHREEVRYKTNKRANCVMFVRHTDEQKWDDDTKKKFMILDLDWDGYNSVAKSKMECYRYRKNWRGKYEWKLWWTDMECDVSIIPRDIDCNEKTDLLDGNSFLYDHRKTSWAAYITAKVRGELVLGMRVKSGAGELGAKFIKNGSPTAYFYW